VRLGRPAAGANPIGAHEVWTGRLEPRRVPDPRQRKDQREIKETREALRWIKTCHLGHYNNRGKYRTDLMSGVLLDDFTCQGLPDEHGITMRVRKDEQAWYAWRRTLSGHVLGIGMNKGSTTNGCTKVRSRPRASPVLTRRAVTGRTRRPRTGGESADLYSASTVPLTRTTGEHQSPHRASQARRHTVLRDGQPGVKLGDCAPVRPAISGWFKRIASTSEAYGSGSGLFSFIFRIVPSARRCAPA